MKRVVYISLFLILSWSVQSQDAQFSQFGTTISQNNSALTGVFDGNDRVILAYRDQLYNPLGEFSYRSFLLSYDRKFHLSTDAFAIGIDLEGDRSGSSRYQTSRGSLRGSYIMQIAGQAFRKARRHYLSFGAKIGIGQQRMTAKNLWFGRQYNVDGGFIDFDANSFEDIMSENINSTIYSDMAVGLTWYSADAIGNSLYAGLGIDHINRANIGLYKEKDFQLNTRYVINMGVSFPIERSILSILPSAMFAWQGPYSQYNFGSQIRCHLGDRQETSLRLGFFMRLSKDTSKLRGDAFVLTSAFEVGRIIIGISYDYTLSDLDRANRDRGAFEMTLSYTSPTKRKRKPMACPDL